MSTIDTIGSLVLVIALLALNVRAFRADSANLDFRTKVLMAVSWVVIIAVVAFVLDRMQA